MAQTGNSYQADLSSKSSAASTGEASQYTGPVNFTAGPPPVKNDIVMWLSAGAAFLAILHYIGKGRG